MAAAVKRLWILTFANLGVVVLLILVLYGLMLGLAVLAPVIFTTPVAVTLLIGVTLSLLTLRYVRRVDARRSRYAAYFLNGGALLLYSTIVVVIAATFFGSTEARFLIPDSYQGDVYVIHDVHDGQAEERTGRQVTFRIPHDGIFRTKAPITSGWTRTKYFYVRSDGGLKEITNFWPTTIPNTPENLANHKDIGVFFPRSGEMTITGQCPVHYEQFYVGTRAYLLSSYKEADLGRYLRNHPVSCDSTKSEAMRASR